MQLCCIVYVKISCNKGCSSIVACNNVASCMVVFCMQQMLHETKLHRVCRVLHATCCMEIEHVLFSCNILHQNYINYYDNDNDKHYQKYDQAIKIDNRKSSLLNTSFNNQCTPGLGLVNRF